MKLQIEGVPSQEGVTVELIHEAATYMMALLMTEDMSRFDSIGVEICVCHDMMSNYGRAAESNWMDDRLRPDNFYIDMDAHLGHRGTLISLAHELVHVKQMAFGQRQESLDGKAMRWMGMLIRPDDLNYYDLPWEIEAHGREFGLYDRFVKHQQGVIDIKPAMIIDPNNHNHIRIVNK